MELLITGGTGFVGRPLVERLVAAGHECVVVSRDPAAARTRLPAGARAVAYTEPWPAVAGVIHLAGESIVGLWTPAKRRRIMGSRVNGTRLLVNWLKQVQPRPGVLLSMSAVGIYGDRPGEVVAEDSPLDPAGKFRAQVCLAWEMEALAAQAPETRVVLLRLGNVMDPAGGFLGELLNVYRRAPVVGFGSPPAMLSWISLRDTVALIAFALENQAVSGPLNVTAPRPVSQGELTALVAAHLGKRVWGHLPGGVLRLGLGAFADAFLDSQVARPGKALAHGFQFNDESFAAYMRQLAD